MIRDSLLRSQRRSLRSLCLVCNCGKACIPPDTKGSCHFRFNLVIMCAGVKSQEKKPAVSPLVKSEQCAQQCG